MGASDWGLCNDGHWWPMAPEASPANTTLGVRVEEALQPFGLHLSGNRGCPHGTPGEPAHAAGSSTAPPTVEPQRCTRRSRWSETSGILPRSPNARHEMGRHP